MKKIFTLILITIFSSCALRNSKEVIIAIDSDPTGAKVFIDDKYYGQTVRDITLRPDRNYRLRLVKDGYRPVEAILETEFSMRKRRYMDNRRCQNDFMFSIFILPLMGLNSSGCRDFTKGIYYFDLEREQVGVFNFGGSYVPPEYIPPQSAAAAQTIYNTKTIQLPPTMIPAQQAMQPVQMAPAQMPPQGMAPAPGQSAMSGNYSNPYQNYNQASPAVAPVMQAPTDFDSSYKAPAYYDQSTQPYTGARGGWVDGSTGQNFNQSQPGNYYYDESGN